ncbi:MAG: hypothetical protein CL843_16455 [Crocinitomicaceae bacterium]|nr:hypothetical protein [Crocinitomicaceae bacterium]|tara:strand:+ start:66 stop:359 length:294 start_codon:yes stop_codon:yes gene_type:complete
MLVRHNIQVGETLEDISMLKYGSVDGVSKILEDNPNLSWDSELIGGEVLLIEKDYFTNKEMAAYLDEVGAAPASAVTESVEVEPAGDFNNDFNNDFS